MDSRTPTLAEVLRTAMRAELGDVHVALPGRVEKYYAAEQKADVKPLLMRGLVTGDGEDVVEPLPVIPGVPVAFPRAGGFFVSFPVAAGDHVLLVFCERSIDRFAVGNGADTDPVDLRRHSLADAVAYPGFYPFSKSFAAHATDMVMGKDGSARIHLKPSGEVHLGQENPAEFVALATKVLNELTTIKGELTARTTIFGAHTHSGVTTGTGSSGGPSATYVAPTPAGSVAATKVKAL